MKRAASQILLPLLLLLILVPKCIQAETVRGREESTSAFSLFSALFNFFFKPTSQPKKLRAETRTSIKDETIPNIFKKHNDNFIVGSQAIFSPKWNSYRIAPYADHEYNETGFDMLTEFRDSSKLSGLNQFKFKLSTNTCESYKLLCNSKQLNSLTELSQQTEIAETFADSAIKWYHLWVSSFNLPKMLAFDLTPEILKAEYDETYQWATHMLETYAGTEKVFFAGNWEGDWQLLWASQCRQDGKFNLDCSPTPEVIERYIQWANTRQKAIDDAKEAVQAQGVDLFFYIEFNLGDENFDSHPNFPDQERPTILNSVIPEVNPDFLSYSSYKSTNKYIDYPLQTFNQVSYDDSFFRVLDYAESKLSDKSTDFSVLGDLPKRVFIGEFGPPRKFPDRVVTAAAHTFRAAIEWGCPFVLQWETYDNDSNTVPLVPRETEDLSILGPMRQLMKDWNEAAQLHIALSNPSPEEFRKWGVGWFERRIDMGIQ